MQFPFEDLPHQAAATGAIVDIFENAIEPAVSVYGQPAGSAGHGGFRLHDDALRRNLRRVTLEQKVAPQDQLKLLKIEDLLGVERTFPNFAVEMETGTGKTYVYIETALHLAELHGLRKFIILVPSLAIRAGAVGTFKDTAAHFRSKFPDLRYAWGVLGEGSVLAEFGEPSGTVRFLIASVQSIQNPESNTIYQASEQPQLWADPSSGMASVAGMKPVVIVDEPQNLVTPLKKRALATLDPLFVLRYSATHLEPFNLVHRLGPKAAKDQGLVKSVSVKGIVPADTGVAYLLVNRLRTRRRRLVAEAVIDQRTGATVRRVEIVLQPGTDLFEESGRIEAYRNMAVERLEREPDRVCLDNGQSIDVGIEVGPERTSIWRDQLRHTIRQHFMREKEVRGAGYAMKVLSLFFVERVADYVGEESVLPKMFDEVFREEWEHAGRSVADCPDPASVRTHYFPSTKTGILKDTRGLASEADYEERAFEEIVKDKKLLLDTENPRAFIFSHSALKEGWDNPNVFQVCFLRHTRSELERRQQIGRGLRLPVDYPLLRRVKDPAINQLTLIVDESFVEFRDGLNAEYVAGAGGTGQEPELPEVDDADDEVVVRRRKEKFESEHFMGLWERIRYRARYRVTLSGESLPGVIAESERLEEVRYLPRRANVIQQAQLEWDESGRAITDESVVAEDRGTAVELVGRRLPILIELIEDELGRGKFPLVLSRPTLSSIVRGLPLSVQKRAIDDPAGWTRIVAGAIRESTIEEMVDHISYEPLPESHWWDAEVVFVEVERMTPPKSDGDEDPSYGVVSSPEVGANLYDAVIYDSHEERSFAGVLENDRDHIKLFTKLPRRFKVATPVGEYSPDWAIVYEIDGLTHVYLVRETKHTLDLEDLDRDEAMKIRFAKHHFLCAPHGEVHYAHTTAAEGVRLERES